MQYLHTSKRQCKQPFNFRTSLLVASMSAVLVACGGGSNNSNNNGSGQEKPVTQASYYLAKYTGNITPAPAVSWKTTDHDERVRQIKVDGDNLVVLNRWFNGIVTVPTNASGETTTPIGFAALTTAGHHKASTDEDYISGASEHLLLDAWFTDDKKAMYALVNKPRRTVSADDTYGLFKVPLNADGTVPSQTIKGKTVYHRSAGVKRVGDGMGENSLKLTKALPLADGRVLAFDKNHNAVAVYSSDLILDKANSFAMAEGDEIESWTSNADAVYLLIKGKDSKLSLQKRSLTNLGKVAKSISVDQGEYLATNKNTNYIALAGGNSVKLLKIDLSEINSFSLTHKTTGMSLANDGNRLALATEANGELVLIDTNTQTPAMTILDLGTRFGTFSLGDKNSLFISRKSGEVQKVSLAAKPVALSASELVKTALDNATAKAINHGYDASAVRYNLELTNANTGGLPNVAYTWTSNSNAVNASTGSITQPAIGADPVNAGLTLTATANYNGKTATGNKTLALTVLPKVTEQSYTRSVNIPYALADYSFRVLAANTSGSKLALFARKKGGVVLVNNVSNQLTANETLVQLPEPYNKSDAPAMTWTNDNTLLVVANQSNDDAKVGALLKYDTASSTWTTLKKYAYPVYTATFSEDNTSVSIQLKVKADSNTSYQLVTHQLADMSQTADYTLPQRFSRFTTNKTGNILYGAKFDRSAGYSILRLNKGKQDAEITTTGYSFSMALVGSQLLTGDSNGNFNRIANATASIAPANTDLVTTYTAHSGYNGTSYPDDHHYGRSYSIAGANNKVITMYSDVGLSIFEPTSAVSSGYIEKQFVADTGIYRFTVSGDNKHVFTYGDGKVNLLNIN